jgi:hypothetical protein
MILTAAQVVFALIGLLVLAAAGYAWYCGSRFGKD